MTPFYLSLAFAIYRLLYSTLSKVSGYAYRKIFFLDQTPCALLGQGPHHITLLLWY
jgi:hypothetical protein